MLNNIPTAAVALSQFLAPTYAVVKYADLKVNVPELRASKSPSYLLESFAETNVGNVFSLNTPMFSKLNSIKSELDSYLHLQNGWDGDGSVEVDRSHVATAKKFLDVLPSGIPLPRSMLTHDGEVGFYWKDDNIYADVVIEGDGLYSIFIRKLKLEGKDEIYHPSLSTNDDNSELLINLLS